MSNFDFMNNQEFLGYPACKILYENVILAENAYFSDHEKCALKVRFILEQLCIFVSEFKKANYPEQVYMLGMYWNEKNRFEFIKVFHYNNVKLIREVNAISRSFLHSGMPAREDIYPEMLKKVYYLLLWLYKELGCTTTLSNRDYSEDKIPVQEGGEETGEPTIFYSSKELLQDLKKYYPNCNTDGLCNVERKGDKFIVTDLEGNLIEEMVAPERLEYSKAQVRQLESELANKKEEFDHTKMEFLQRQSEQEDRINQLEEEIANITSDNQKNSSKQNHRIKELTKEIEQLKTDKEEVAGAYREKLKNIGSQFDELQSQYEALLPAEEQRNILRKQVKSLIAERTILENNFLEQQDNLLEEIAQAKQRLKDAQNRIDEMGISAQESKKIIGQLEYELKHKEKELFSARDRVQSMFQNFQFESSETIKKYQNKINDLEVIVTSLMTENKKFKEVLSENNDKNRVRAYLKIVEQGIARINEGYAQQRQNPNEKKLREYLRRVKDQYENQISELEFELLQKDKELQEEKKRYHHLFQVLYASKAGEKGKVAHPTGSKGGKNKKGVLKSRLRNVLAASMVCLFLCIGVLFFYKKQEAASFYTEKRESVEDNTAGLISSVEHEVQATEIILSENIGVSEEGESEERKKTIAEENGTELEENVVFAENALNQLYQDNLQQDPPEDYMMIQGINEKLLEEIGNLDLLSISLWGKETSREDMYYIGATRVPGMYKNGANMYFMGLESKRHLCNMKGNEVIKFAFVSGNRIGHIVVATEISNLSDKLSRGSTMEEVIAVLGNEITVTELEEPTMFANVEKETAVLFQFQSYNGAIICFNEAGEVCDYAYLGIGESK